MKQSDVNPVLCVVMDGLGLNPSPFGNAVHQAFTPNLDYLMGKKLSLPLAAHGKAVGLPTDSDIGNSEVGHNALGAGQIYDQGAKLVDEAMKTGSLFTGRVWKNIVASVNQKQSTLHLLGLLSDGNVHSHENHLYALIKQAKHEGIKRVRIHVLLDGRDVPERSAEIYAARLLQLLDTLRSSDFDVQVASGGGRMQITMDRYEADWSMVERGWKIHVEGQGPSFPDLMTAINFLRQDSGASDQNLPGFVISDERGPVGRIQPRDSVIFFNFRGDRSIEISRAFSEKEFSIFDRGAIDDIGFAGMMEYDGDLKIPKNYLVSPPEIENTLGAHLCVNGLRQFACSETQKFGHVTFFWNGNRSGYFDKNTEEYVEIPSDKISFDLKPWMKAHEITDLTIDRMQRKSFDLGRINLANGDMVGHTGCFQAAVTAVEVVDAMIGRLIRASQRTGTILVVTADHGNCDQMFEAREESWPDWQHNFFAKNIPPKTSHSVFPVPFLVFDPKTENRWSVTKIEKPNLGHVANSLLTLMGLPTQKDFLPPLIGRI